MNKLRKLALGGNIQLSDVSFETSNDEIVMILNNKDKSLHGDEYSNRGKYNTYLDNEIGSISFEIGEVGEKDSVGITVNVLEIREQYQQTRVVKYLIDYFSNKVINYYVEKFGKEHVVLLASFENAKLKEFLERQTKKLGLKLFDMNEAQDNKSEKLRLLISKLESENIKYTVITYNDVFVSDCLIEKFVNIAEESGYFSTSSLEGAMNRNDQDISFCLESSDYHFYDPLTFTYDMYQKTVTFSSFNTLKEMYTFVTKTKLNNVFSDGTTFKFNDFDKIFNSVDEIINYLDESLKTNLTANRLRRL